MDLTTLTSNLEKSLEYYTEQNQTPNQGLLNLRAAALINQLEIVNGSVQTSTGNLPAVLYSGQVAAGVGATGLGSQVLTSGVTLTALSTNSSSLFVGPSGVTNLTGIELKPGNSLTLAISNLNLVYFAGTAGEKISFIAS